MNRLAIFAVGILLGATATGNGQVISPTRSEPSGATVNLDHKTVRAGEKVPFTFTLNVPATKSTDFYGNLILKSGGDSIRFDGHFAVGEQTVQIAIQIPPDVDGGDYALTEFNILIQGERRPTTIRVAEQVLRVEPLPKLAELLPTKATVEIVLDQRQFIRAQAEPIEQIREDLVGGLDKDARETADLRQRLTDAVKAADSLLLSVKQKYISLYKTQPEFQPVLFDDCHRRYQAMLRDLNPVPAGRGGQTAALLEVQLSRRPDQQPSSDWKNHSLEGSYPPLATATLDVLDWNIEAYLRIGNTGIETFPLAIASTPAGATVSYRRIGEDYITLGQPTNLTKVTFPYALWWFKFEKQGCRDYIRQFDPIHDSSPTLDVELYCKGK